MSRKFAQDFLQGFQKGKQERKKECLRPECNQQKAGESKPAVMQTSHKTKHTQSCQHFHNQMIHVQQASD
jgi:hypothetical protein